MNAVPHCSIRLLYATATAILVLLAAATEAHAATLEVDADRSQCPRADYTSIQQAVDAASPGDTITVCADLYAEQVTIAKPLTVRAKGEPAAHTDCFTASTADLTRDAIVDPADGGFTIAVKLRADDIVLRGLVVQGASVGIDAADAFSGYRISRNLIQDHSLFAVEFGASGERRSRADHNCIRNNQWGLVSELDDDTNYPLPPVGTDPEPYARVTFNARIDHNMTTGNAIGLEASGPGPNGDVTIAHNRSHRDGAGLAVGRLSGGAIVDNHVTETTESRPGFAGIMIDPGTEDLIVARNRVVGGTPRGINFTGNGLPDAAARRVLIVDNEIRGMLAGIVLLAPFALVDSAFVANTVIGNRGAGITLNFGARNTVAANTVAGNAFSGIVIGPSTSGYHVYDNVSDNNGRHGILSGATATQHRFERNSMHGNGVEDPLQFFDANDFNFLQNTWVGNDCETDNPPGAICGQ